jgi:hypothetical protein
MKLEYKGFDIEVNKEKSVGGDEFLYYSAFRKNDDWELTSGSVAASNSVREWVNDMKKLVDEYLENPEEYEDDL